MKKITIGNESSRDLSQHSVGAADGEVWLWGPETNNYGSRQWGVNEGRYGSAYSTATFWSRTEAVAEVRRLRNQRAGSKSVENFIACSEY